jgi:hypothetical protein
MKIRPLEVKLFHADGRTNTTKRTVAFRNFTNAPKKCVFCNTSSLVLRSARSAGNYSQRFFKRTGTLHERTQNKIAMMMKMRRMMMMMTMTTTMTQVYEKRTKM